VALPAYAIIPISLAAHGSSRLSGALRSFTTHGSRAAVVRRSGGTRSSSRSDDELGGYRARSALSERSERSNQNAINTPNSGKIDR